MLSEPLIEIQNQILGEAVDIVGTPFRLHYRSDRVPGRRAAYSMQIPLSGKSIPPGLKGIEMEVSIAGQHFTRTLPPSPAQRHTFTWDGKDAAGRTVTGRQLGTIRIGYILHAAYPRPEVTKWHERTIAAGAWDARVLGLGGWSLSVHHTYDAVGNLLFLGDGSRRRNLDRKQAITPRGEVVIPAKDGRELHIFEDTGRHLRTVNAFTGAVRYRFDYDAVGRLTAIEDGDGNITRIERGVPAVAAIVAPGGPRTTLTISGDGYLIAIANPAADIAKFVYSHDGLLISRTDPRGTIHRFTYDEQGRLIRHDGAAAGSSVLARGPSGRGFQVAVITALQREFDYLVERLPTGEERRVNKCCGGPRTEVLIGTDGTRTMTYADGTTAKLLEPLESRWGARIPVSKTLGIATPGGRKANLTVERQATLTDPADPLRLEAMTETVAINGRKYASIFDWARREITSRTPAGRQTVLTLDERGRVVRAEAPGVLPLTYRYDQRGRLTAMEQGGGAAARTAILAYDAQGRVATVTDPLDQATRYEYDPAGRVIRQVLAGNREVGFAYDSNGDPKAVIPAGRAHVFAFTPARLLEEYRTPDVGMGSEGTAYAYDADGQLTQIVGPDGRTVAFAYDKVGRLATVTYPGRQLRLTFDAKTGQLSGIAGDDGSLAFTYDGFLHTGTAWDGAVKGTVGRSYDDDFRLASLTVNGGPHVPFKYDPDGLLTQAGGLTLERETASGRLKGTRLGGVVAARDYNEFGEPKRYTATANDKDLFTLAYERDRLGRITKLVESIDGETNTYLYTYDRANRLAEVALNGTRIGRYEYENGNRLLYEGRGVRLRGRHDPQDRLLEYGGATFTHTPNGEWATKTVDEQTTTYDYDAFGNLRAVLLPDATRIDYVIDGDNRRVGKKVDGKLVQGFLYDDPWKPVAELDADGRVVSRFIYAGQVNVPAYLEKGGRTYRILTDHLGSPRFVVDVASSAVVQRLDYDEFGNVLNDTHPGFQPFGFAGGMYDSQTRLTRFGARDYDAWTGRWTAREPIGFGWDPENLYAYAHNDPVNWVDVNGLYPWWSNAIAGFGDTLSFGISAAIREGFSHWMWGESSGVSYCSWSYAGGVAVGIVWGIVIGRGIARGPRPFGRGGPPPPSLPKGMGPMVDEILEAAKKGGDNPGGIWH